MKALAITLSLLLPGCATGLMRFATGAAIGSGAGAAGGAMLSPNDESKGMNALVFGLSGALLGGLFGILTDPHPKQQPEKSSLQSKELNIGANVFEVTPQEKLPPFVKDRLTPVIVEEYREQDSVGEDGALHEPHNVYRIKRQAELISKPASKEGGQHE